jgi:hypothetical protein
MPDGKSLSHADSTLIGVFLEGRARCEKGDSARAHG